MQDLFKNIVKFSLVFSALTLVGCETYDRKENAKRPVKRLKRSTTSELAQLDVGSKTKYSGERDYWFGCSYQNDCTEIYHKCVGNTIGKKYYDEANEYYYELADQTSCGENFSKPTQKGYSVECVDNRCTYQ